MLNACALKVLGFCVRVRCAYLVHRSCAHGKPSEMALRECFVLGGFGPRIQVTLLLDIPVAVRTARLSGCVRRIGAERRPSYHVPGTLRTVRVPASMARIRAKLLSIVWSMLVTICFEKHQVRHQKRLSLAVILGKVRPQPGHDIFDGFRGSASNASTHWLQNKCRTYR